MTTGGGGDRRGGRHRFTLAAGGALLLAAVLASGSGAGGASGRGDGSHRAGSAAPAPAGTAEATEPAANAGRELTSGPGLPDGDGTLIRFVFDSRARSYLLLPALGAPAGRLPGLLLVLHPDAARVRDVAATSGFDQLRRQGVTLAYPAGIGGSWNAGDCCGRAHAMHLDDVGFLSAVLADVPRHTPVDSVRRGLIGYSGGGMLVYRFLCGPHPRLAAAAEVNGSLQVHCSRDAAVPDFLALHGGRDGSVGLSQPIYVSRLGIAPRPAEASFGDLALSAACTARSDLDDAEVTRTTWTGCRGGSSLLLVVVLVAGHRWEDVGGSSRTVGWLAARLAPPGSG